MSNYDDERDQYALPIEITVTTKAPSKWRFVDLETGEVYKFADFADDVYGEHYFQRDHDFVVSSEVMNERTRRRLDIRASGSAGPHDDTVPRERAKREAIMDQVEDPEGAEEVLVARDADRGVGPAVRGDLSNWDWEARRWDTHYDRGSE